MTYTPALNVPFESFALNNIYVPANVPGQQNMRLGNVKYGEYGLSWWKDNCFIKYPYLLVSAAYGLAYPNFREVFGIGKEVLFLGDSGGYQVVTQGKYLNPVDVLRWLENNCNIGFILDYPPYGDDGSSFFGTLKDFDKNMKITEENTEIMTTKKENDKLKLYGVIQGDNIKRIRQWYNACKDYDVQGWSLSPKPSYDVFKIAQYGAFAIENLDTPLHFLAVSGINTMAITAYISKYYKKLITFDSSSYANGCMQKVYLVPFNMSVKLDFGKNGHRVDSLPCSCPVCSVATPKDMWERGSISGALMNLHNLYWYITYSNTLQSLIKYDDLFMEFVKKLCTPKTLQAMEYLDYYMECKDIEQANRKFSQYIKSSSGYEQESFRI